MNMQDQRANPRKRVDEKIELIDINSGNLLGNLVNISLGGFMLLTNQPIATGQLFQLRVQLSTPIELGAECLWLQPVADSEHSWAGFQIIDISEQASDRIKALIDQWTE